MKSILFVCTGNTCRSSMAEAIFNDIAGKNQIKNVTAESAGTEAFEGMPANEKATEILKDKGIDMSGHVSKRINLEMVDKNDIILTMTRTHKAQVTSLYPHAKDKVFTLKEYAGESSASDIKDPYGQSSEVYNRCAEELERSIRAVVEKL